ncbi:unnamed protein product [Durusdinium trenchii]|uniref:Uncharacterized protein n=1 Tax=Durusdinium trenchii TaxID=1381693 RepID=A0ABP0N151_9DINO
MFFPFDADNVTLKHRLQALPWTKAPRLFGISQNANGTCVHMPCGGGNQRLGVRVRRVRVRSSFRRPQVRRVTRVRGVTGSLASNVIGSSESEHPKVVLVPLV